MQNARSGPFLSTVDEQPTLERIAKPFRNLKTVHERRSRSITNGKYQSGRLSQAGPGQAKHTEPLSKLVIKLKKANQKKRRTEAKRAKNAAWCVAQAHQAKFIVATAAASKLLYARR